ncbi:hypothetical protein FPQ18DRAFT_349534 [Pyronema domesticum]|nr:hypothetical protein FPQ18DRAFT_349534 [Pyronema domesticum]
MSPPSQTRSNFVAVLCWSTIHVLSSSVFTTPSPTIHNPTALLVDNATQQPRNGSSGYFRYPPIHPSHSCDRVCSELLRFIRLLNKATKWHCYKTNDHA